MSSYLRFIIPNHLPVITPIIRQEFLFSAVSHILFSCCCASYSLIAVRHMHITLEPHKCIHTWHFSYIFFAAHGVAWFTSNTNALQTLRIFLALSAFLMQFFCYYILWQCETCCRMPFCSLELYNYVVFIRKMMRETL